MIIYQLPWRERSRALQVAMTAILIVRVCELCVALALTGIAFGADHFGQEGTLNIWAI